MDPHFFDCRDRSLLIGIIAWEFRYWPEEHQVNKFFDALQQQNFETAYGVWMNDPAGKGIRSNTIAILIAPSCKIGVQAANGA